MRCSALACPMTGSTAERRRSSRLIVSVTRRFWPEILLEPLIDSRLLVVVDPVLLFTISGSTPEIARVSWISLICGPVAARRKTGLETGKSGRAPHAVLNRHCVRGEAKDAPGGHRRPDSAPTVE
jgi:hypothetical protein